MTPGRGLLYKKQVTWDIFVFCGVDQAGDVKDKRSTLGNVPMSRGTQLHEEAKNNLLFREAVLKLNLEHSHWEFVKVCG